jgi:hypothetical protein
VGIGRRGPHQQPSAFLSGMVTTSIGIVSPSPLFILILEARKCQVGEAFAVFSQRGAVLNNQLGTNNPDDSSNHHLKRSVAI